MILLTDVYFLDSTEYDTFKKIKMNFGTMKLNFEKEIERITTQIVEKYKPEKIILFGSAARGETNADSDADFLIVKKQTPYYGVDRIRELSRLINRNIAVDFLIYRSDEFEKRLKMEDPFLELIIKEGKVLYG
jgi:predicted nucleotidyltransferase